MKKIDSKLINDNKYIVEDLIKENGIYCLVAKPKVGKSLLALQLANSLVNNIEFLNKKVSFTPVLYVSTELTEIQLVNRIYKTNYQLNDNFFFLERDNSQELNIDKDLKNEFLIFRSEYRGKFIIIDMLLGIKYNKNYDINDYKNISEILTKYRLLAKELNLTFLLVHHLNKSGKTLGSTGIEGFVDGTFYLNDLGDNEFLFNSNSRDYESIELNLIRNDNLIFEITEEDNDELDPNLNIFLRYIIDKKDITFTPAEMVSKLKLFMSPTKFGKLINKNINKLEQEGVYIDKNKTATARYYHARFIDPMTNNDY